MLGDQGGAFADRVVVALFDDGGEPPVRVGARSGNDFHLLQIFAKNGDGKPREALVMYPADGYWRLKPLPLARFGDAKRP